MINYLENIIEELKESIVGLKYSKDISHHLICISLYCTIYENSTACLFLLKKRVYNSIPILLRNILEAHVDLINLSNDEDYVYFMSSAYLEQRNKILRLAKTTDNENKYLTGLKSMSDINEKYQESVNEYNDLVRRDYSPLNISEKFNRANLQELYFSIYRLLCQESHNNLSSLSSRHLDEKSNEIILFNLWDEDRLLPYIDSLNGILIISFQSLLKAFNKEEDKHFIKAKELLKEFREKYNK